MQEENNESLSVSHILADYLPKLVRLAEKNMTAKLRQKVDAEDVGQSVMRTVFRQASEGIISIEHSQDFWRLLVAITLNKVRKKARYWKAQKRSIDLEQPIGRDGPPLEEIAVAPNESPTREVGAMLAEVLAGLDERLDDNHRAVLAAKLQNKTHAEIAELLNVSTKTVGRRANNIKAIMSELLDENVSK